MEGSDRAGGNTRAIHTLCNTGNDGGLAHQRVTEVETMDTISCFHCSAYYELCGPKVRRGWDGCSEVSLVPFVL